MLYLSLLALVYAAAISGVLAAPAQPVRRAVTTVSATTLAGFAPFSQFSRAAYCPTTSLKTWKCGQACNALPGFEPTLVGGDGNAVQIYFVGYWPSENAVVVAHQGTDPTKFVSLLTDANILQDPLDTKLFPGVSSSVKVHDGFRNAHALTATKILTEVKRLMALKGSTKVITVGHSLGGALAQLDALLFTLNLPSGTSIQSITYGLPRVGNAAYAALIDSKVPNFKRINNKKDLVPIVPGRALGFTHAQGEVHILSSGKAVACSGNDATDSNCQISSVPNIFVGNILDHLGPYEGVYMGTIFCT